MHYEQTADSDTVSTIQVSFSLKRLFLKSKNVGIYTNLLQEIFVTNNVK